MADTKISALTALTGVNAATGDLAVVVDVSDSTMAATGTDKKITLAETRIGLNVLRTVVNQTSGFTLSSADIGKFYHHVGSAVFPTVTLPLNADDPIPVGAMFEFAAGAQGFGFDGADPITINGSTAQIDLNGNGSVDTNQGYARLIKIATNDWILCGYPVVAD